jgi:hypothetical protein
MLRRVPRTEFRQPRFYVANCPTLWWPELKPALVNEGGGLDGPPSPRVRLLISGADCHLHVLSSPGWCCPPEGWGPGPVFRLTTKLGALGRPRWWLKEDRASKRQVQGGSSAIKQDHR